MQLKMVNLSAPPANSSLGGRGLMVAGVTKMDEIHVYKLIKYTANIFFKTNGCRRDSRIT